jgi:hypothetical protein
VLKLTSLCQLGRLLAVLLLVLVPGCDAFGIHQATRVAKTLLFQPDGRLDNATVTAALNARFPSGSKFTELELFVKTWGGRCGHSPGRVWCTIPLSGTICAVSVIAMSVVMLGDDTIQHIEATGESRTC